MAAYYNEIDLYAAQWLRNLIDKNLIAPDGYPGLVGQLRAYGNAINAKVAEEFIRAYLACKPD